MMRSLGRVCACEGVPRDPRLRFRVLPRASWEGGSYRLRTAFRIISSERFLTPSPRALKILLSIASRPDPSLNTLHVMSLAPTSLPAPQIGYIFLVASALLLAMGTHAILFSALFPPPPPGRGEVLGTGEEDQLRPVIGGITTTNTTIIAVFVDALARDTHYKYLALFSVPVCAYFVIANWVGWQFFRNS